VYDSIAKFLQFQLMVSGLAFIDAVVLEQSSLSPVQMLCWTPWRRRRAQAVPEPLISKLMIKSLLKTEDAVHLNFLVLDNVTSLSYARSNELRSSPDPGSGLAS
jgi:hypothetical protein